MWDVAYPVVVVVCCLQGSGACRARWLDSQGTVRVRHTHLCGALVGFVITYMGIA